MQTAKPIRLPGWLQALAGTLGGGGLFVIAFLDSSVLSFPMVADLLVIEVAVAKPVKMPYYAAMATLGSVAGCVLLYLLARKGGEAFFRKRAGARADRVRDWVKQNAFLSIFLPSLLPPPMPFKVFILAAGVFQAPLGTFVLALVIGRGLRYFIEGMIAVRYGPVVAEFLGRHGGALSLAAAGTFLAVYLLSRFLFRPAREEK